MIEIKDKKVLSVLTPAPATYNVDCQPDLRILGESISTYITVQNWRICFLSQESYCVPPTMSWRQCTLYRPKDFNLLVVLPLPRRTSRCSPCSSRRGISCGITTTRPLLAVVTGDSTARQETPKTRRIESRLTQRRCYNVPATTDDPIQPTFADTRCAHLLASDREAADANEISCFRDRRVSVSGFIKTIRKQKHQAFADFTDGSCWQPIQVVLGSKLAAPYAFSSHLRAVCRHADTRVSD